MKKYSLLLILLLCLSHTGFGQEAVATDLVLLKDGSLLRGSATISDEKLIVEIEGGSRLEIKMAEVASISFGVDQDVKFSRLKERALHVSPARGIYQTLTDGLLLFGGLPQFSDVNPTLGRTLQYTIGYRFHRFAQFGLGTGLNLYAINKPFNYGIFYVEYQGDLVEASNTTFYSLKMGLGGNNTYFDLMLNPTIGYQFPSKTRLHLKLSAGYLLQRDFYTIEYFSSYERKNILLHSIGFYVTMTF